ncbi:hypothetical protein IQ07DRAFT_588263 [Pyrenochaeta sp. DS3sAY3a]|nr:hypothetical protein IQ07DRAFT_588263 [Pyrenochaeta sp. DS3sAY3a]
MADVCANCKQTATAKNIAALKNCAGCKTTRYCDRDCQKADWKTHKKVCLNTTAEAGSSGQSRSSTTSPLKNLDTHVPKPFTKLDEGTYLHDRSEHDVFKLLIDSFRISQEDEYKFTGEVSINSIYDGKASSIIPFRKFLRFAFKREGLLPPWFTKEKGKECEIFGMSDEWSELRACVEKQDLIDHYGDRLMPMQLRMLAEAVYGKGPGGQNGSAMRKMMMMAENGEGTTTFL